VFSAPFDVRLTRKAKASHEEITTVVQPDLCVICDLSKLDERGCLGAPDLVIEILSSGNSKKEMREKFEVYQESGVREYWLVNPTDENVIIYTLNEQGIYIGLAPYIAGDMLRSAIFPELLIDLGEVFAL
jgi:Uma2 family endonuclease